MNLMEQMRKRYYLSGISNQANAVVRILPGGWNKSKHSDFKDRFKDRYAGNWKSTRAKAHSSTAGICCYCCRKPSQEVHHGHYRRLPIVGLIGSLLWFLLFPAGFLLSPLFLWVAIGCAPVILLLPQLKITGHEIIGWDVFPVCGTHDAAGSCHSRLHNKRHWITDKRNPKYGNRNTIAMMWRLRLSWLMLKLTRDRR